MRKPRYWIHLLPTLAALALTACDGQLPSAFAAGRSADPRGTAIQATLDDSALQEVFEVQGTVQSMAPDAWIVEGLTLAVTTETEVKGAIAVGDTVKVHAFLAADGTLTAREIELADPAPEGEDDDNRNDEIEFIGVVETVSSSAWTISGQTLAVTPETEIKGDISVGDTVKVHAFLAADGALTAREIELAGDEGTQDNSEVEFKGTVESISDGLWVVSGQSLLVNASTEIEVTIQVGDFVEVKAVAGADGTLTALEIEREDEGDDNGQDNQGEDDDSGDHNEDGDHHGGHDDDEHDDGDHSGPAKGGD